MGRRRDDLVERSPSTLMSFKPKYMLAAAALIAGAFAFTPHAGAAPATNAGQKGAYADHLAVANSGELRTIAVTAHRYEFEPETITVHEGEPVKLVLTSKDVTHGIADDDLGIPNTVIYKGKTSTVTFTPKKLGTFKVHCSVFCGIGHGNMVLTVKVIK